MTPLYVGGMVSQGMVLAVTKEGGLALLGPISEVVNGSRVS